MFRNIYRMLIAPASASDSWLRDILRRCGEWVAWDSAFVETSRYAYSRSAYKHGARAYLSKPSAEPRHSGTEYRLIYSIQSRGCGGGMITVVTPSGTPIATFHASANGIKSIADTAASAAAYAEKKTAKQMDRQEWKAVVEDAIPV